MGFLSWLAPLHQLTTLGHLRTRGAGQHTRDAQDSRYSSSEPVAHAQFDPLYDLRHVESFLVCKQNENQSGNQSGNQLTIQQIK